MSKELLFEIGVEEIPARFMANSLKSLQEGAEKALKEARLSFDSVRAVGTPRRLTLLVNGLAETQTDLTEELKGPSVKAAYGDDGAPTKALLGFVRSKGAELDSLTVRTVGNGEYVFVRKEEKGQPATDVLPSLLVGLVESLRFPKPMRWGDNEMRFVRPIRWLVCLFGSDVLPLKIVNIESGRVSRSHRFYGKGEITIDSPAVYRDVLRENYVVVDQDERRELIRQQIADLAAQHDIVVDEDEELLEEVVYLLEYPCALLGSFEEKYMALPPEAIITPMREHQHYFPVRDHEGKLLPHFVTVRNGLSRNLETVAAGNEKVLRARLADAEFYYHEDLKVPLEEHIEQLKKIVFHVTMGTVYDKVARIEELAAALAEPCGADREDVLRGARLAKADLLTHMVYDFPELQGIMGEYYAVAQGEKPAVAQSLREHYLPRFAGDELPCSPAGRVLAIADKLDSVVGFFAMDIEPTGSQDPYALRRQAMGVVQIILDGNLPLRLTDLIEQAYEGVARRYETKNDLAATSRKVAAFFRQRLAVVLGDEGLRYDTIAAVLRNEGEDLCAIREEGRTLEKFRENENFAPLMAGFTRVNNLGKKGVAQFDEKLLQEPAEQTLAAAYGRFREISEKALADGDFEQALLAVAELRAPIDAFLTDVMVMCDDEQLRDSRLGLLKSIVVAMEKVADFEKIVVEK